MDIKTMTKAELITLKKKIITELNSRIQEDYDELENNLIKLITDFEKETGYYVGFDGGDYEDRATNTIKGLFYYTSEYITPYE